MDGLCGLHFVTYLVPNFFQNYTNGPCGLHFVTYLVTNLDLLKHLDLLVVTKCVTMLKPQGTIHILLEN
ncbi:hypothetical protein Hanom_Chr02g00136621 [Helianthus anomalus]